MSEVTLITKHSALLARLEAMTQEQLFERMRQLLDITLDAVIEMALCIRVLDAQGADFSQVRNIWFDRLRCVGHGQVVPELVLMAETDSLFRRLAALPMPDQTKVAEDVPIPVVVSVKNGTIDHRMLPFSAMNDSQVELVFSGHSIRTLDEQAVIFQNRSQTRLVVRLNLRLSDAKHAKLLRSAKRRNSTVEKLVLETLETADLI